MRLITALFAACFLLPLSMLAGSLGYSVTTLSGTALTQGTSNGALTKALYNFPTSCALDTTGNLYVADAKNNIIRKITPTGTVTTLAGNPGVSGSVDGTGSNATFNTPYSVACDLAGNIYVADFGNSTIRKITPLGVVTTLAGSPGVTGSSDGLGSAARFNYPFALTIDSQGNIYVADTYNCTIRKVTPSGNVSTLAGLANTAGAVDAFSTQARFDRPSGIAVDSTGNLYVADTGNNTIRKIDTTLQVTTLAGLAESSGYSDGTTSAARFNYPFGLAVDSASSVYVCDTSNNCIRKISPSGVVTTACGLSQGSSDGVGTSGTFYNPYGLCVDNLGNLYVADAYNNLIRKCTPPAALVLQPVISLSSSSASISVGSQETFSVLNLGLATYTYQWYFNNQLIPGATQASYTLTSSSVTNSGNYSVVVSNSSQSYTSLSQALTVSVFVNPGRLINLSVLSMDGPGSQLMTIGFVTGGSNTTGSQQLLVRGMGPSLTNFGVPSVLQDPVLNVFSSTTTVIASNDNWGSTPSNLASVQAADASTGAFAPVSPTSLDAAVVTTLTPGSYTAQITGKNNTSGNAIAEVYDTTLQSNYTLSTPRLINISCLELVSSGSSLTAGFVISGTTNLRVLIRASGPILASNYAVPNTISDPKLTVFDSNSKVLATNAEWAGDPALSSAAQAVGAFPFMNQSSKDSAVVLSLAPGAYTVQATSATGQSGVTLIEVYEIAGN